MSTAVALHQPVNTGIVPAEFPLRKLFAEHGHQLTPYLHGRDLDRVLMELYLASEKSPNLEKCPANLALDAIARALDTHGVIGQDVYISAFKNSKANRYEPAVMIDYKWKAQMVVAAGGARSIQSHTVYEDEMPTFKITYGSTPGIHHEPAYSTHPNRKIAGAYAVAFMGHLTPPVPFWMTVEEIEAIRKKSKQWSPEKAGPAPIPWYGEKCAVHRVVKLLPKSQKLMKLFAMIDREEQEEFGGPEGEEVAVVEAPFFETPPAPVLTRDTLFDFGSAETQKLCLRTLTGEQLANMIEYKARIPAQWHSLLEHELELREEAAHG